MPTPPPLDAAGAVVPHDHDEIEAGDRVIRRISDRQIVTDGAGARRISSLAYQASGGANGGMSVDIEKFIVEGGDEPEQWVTTPRWIGSVCFSAGFLRGLQFQIGYHPIEETSERPANPYHGEVWGTFSRAQKIALQQNANWFVPIPDVELDQPLADQATG